LLAAVPDEALMLALTSAAQRGVDVTLIKSEIADQFLLYYAQRSYYEELLTAGVQIERYRSPVQLHSKILCIEDDITVVGSSNLDIRSFQLNLEVTLVCYNMKVVTVTCSRCSGPICDTRSHCTSTNGRPNRS
jgi:cardiolipin synthase A/B